MLSVTASGLPAAWISVLRGVHEDGELNQTEYGNRSRFVNGVGIEVKDVNLCWHQRDPFCSKNRIKIYEQELNKSFKHGFAYTYGDRLHAYPHVRLVDYLPLKPFGIKIGEPKEIDQIEVIKEMLREGKPESRRIQAVTWIPAIDMHSNEPPCLQSIWFYPYRDRKVDVHIRYRSWDWFQAAGANMYAIAKKCKLDILEPLGYELKTFRAWGDNVHYYMENEDEVKRVLYG